MKKIFTLIISILAFSLMGIFAGCKGESSLDKLNKEYPLTVIIDYNGGLEGTMSEKTVRCKENSLFLEPGYDTKYPAPQKEGCNIEGYYRGTKDSEGKITFGEKWDFAKDRVTEDITLYVKWVEKLFITIHYGENNSLTDTIPVEENASENWYIYDHFKSVKWENHTFYSYYYDAEYKNKVEFPYNYKENPVKDIYAKFIDGDWLLVEKKTDFNNIKYNTNIYLMNDLDMTGYEDLFKRASTYDGEFNGNGHTLSNISVARATNKTNSVAGLFNHLKKKAYIHDLVIKDIIVNVDFLEPTATGKTNFIGLLAGEIEEGARIENLNINGELKYDSSKSKRPLETQGLYGNYLGEGNFDELYTTITKNIIISDRNKTEAL